MPGRKTIPNQGSRALIILRTCRSSFSAVSKPFRSRFLKVRTHVATLFKIYKNCTPLHRAELKNAEVITLRKIGEFSVFLFSMLQYFLPNISHLLVDCLLGGPPLWKGFAPENEGCWGSSSNHRCSVQIGPSFSRSLSPLRFWEVFYEKQWCN